MGSSVVIYANPGIPWHVKRGNFFLEGFRKIGIPAHVTSDRFRHAEGLPVLLGTNHWKAVERDGDYLLVDRCSFGDTEKFVQLVRNGHGRRGDHRVPQDYGASRWERHGVDLVPWNQGYDRIVLCGQVETFSPHYASLDSWYASVKATHFRPHPASVNTTRLPATLSLDNAMAVTLNSSIAVQAVMQGIPTVTMDEGAMAWDVTGHKPGEFRTPDRLPWCHWLAWTQWSDDEVKEGAPWDCLL